jgi:nitrite reductase/ring-hydroxylating ferredoxin subunit
VEGDARVCDDLVIMLRLVRLVRRRRRREEGTLVRVCADGELADGQIRRIEGLAAIICNVGGRLHALGLVCPHAGARLSRGKIVGGCVECPLHGARFAVEDGTVRRGPAGHGLPAYDVVVREGVVYVSRRPRRQSKVGRPGRRGRHGQDRGAYR